jgi:hypothetical protein
MSGDEGLLIAVYRRDNVETIRALVEDAERLDWRIRLWDLDGADAFGDVTVGSGKGTKFELLNRLLPEHLPAAVIVADDDVMLHAPLDVLVGAARTAGLDLAQPAHSRGSHSTYRFLRARSWLRSRETNFVEIGPLFVVVGYYDSFLPFPDNIGMGWGLEFTWAAEARSGGARMGVLDWITMDHLKPHATSYPLEDEVSRLRGRLAEVGVGSVEEYQRTLHRKYRIPTWESFRRAPR